MTPDTTLPVHITHAAVAYAGRRVLDGITFDVAPGERVAVIGPSGAGSMRCAARSACCSSTTT